MDPFKKKREILDLLKLLKKDNSKPKAEKSAPEFVECSKCGNSVSMRELAEKLYVCENCGYHYKVSAYY
ncbi:MAG: acetyl-CoA carboxylase carboxyl transferase subunit beta, partial [Oscillospiraceae bacterium]